jgi:hypothetical protein
MAQERSANRYVRAWLKKAKFFLAEASLLFEFFRRSPTSKGYVAPQPLRMTA